MRSRVAQPSNAIDSLQLLNMGRGFGSKSRKKSYGAVNSGRGIPTPHNYAREALSGQRNCHPVLRQILIALSSNLGSSWKRPSPVLHRLAEDDQWRLVCGSVGSKALRPPHSICVSQARRDSQ